MKNGWAKHILDMGPLSFVSYLADSEIDNVKKLRDQAAYHGVLKDLKVFDDTIFALQTRKKKL